MAENSLIDISDLCWNAILKESSYYSNTFFNEKHCSEEENRDTNFDLVENRLAYMYKFGYFNAVFIQKCLESFLDKFSEGRELFLKDLKICSLSNGPGFDLLGFFCGIYKFFKCFKSLPIFRTINLYNSWFCISHILFSKVFRSAVESTKNLFSIPHESIHFIQCDIYSTLSSDAQECIKDSDILVMMKVFASTKATSEVVKKSMKEIFSLLKSGSFVFFVGSKKKAKELTGDNVLNNLVSCIHGPIKISIADLPVNQAIANSVSVKPKTSGNAYFIVWQKKDSVLPDNAPKKRRKRKKKKSNIQVEEESSKNHALSEQTNGTDEPLSCSSSCSSSSRQSLSDDSHSASSEKMLQSISPSEIPLPHLKKEENGIDLKNSDFVNSITTLLDKIQLDSEKEDLTTVKGIPHSKEEIICVPEKKSQAKFESCSVTGIKIQTKNQGSLLNKIDNCKLTEDGKMALNSSCDGKMALNSSCDLVSQFKKERIFSEKVDIESSLTNHHNKELNSIQKNTLKTNETIVKSPEVNNRVKDFNLLLQRCENLVTSLEKLANNLTRNMPSSNDQDARCCLRKSCTKLKNPHAYVNPCCLNTMHSHCFRTICNCHMFHHTACIVCPNHVCGKAELN